MIIDEEDYFEHFGVLGMKWGVRKDYETGTGDTKAVVTPTGISPVGSAKKIAIKNNVDKDDDAEYSKQLEAKYGKDSMKSKPGSVEDQEGWSGLTPDQKKAAIALGSVALVVGSGFLIKKYVDSAAAKELIKKERYETFIARSIKDYTDVSELPVNKLGTGLNTHWESGVSLPKGSVLKRLSTVKETEIRPKGFYAAFEDSDIERYKAELPVWWGRWGYQEKSGYLTNIKAATEVKAPSGKESVAIFKKLLENNEEFSRQFVRSVEVIERINASDPVVKEKFYDGMAKYHFQTFSQGWITGTANAPIVKRYFSEVEKAGYNALIDFNDSGKLARTPLRTLHGSDFSIVGHDAVSEKAIELAQKNIKELVMSTVIDFGLFLAHYMTRPGYIQIRQ